jgi:hypothetical protein
MSTRRMLLLATLFLGLLLLPGAAVADKVQSSTDEKGTIHVGTVPPPAQEKAATEKTEGKAPEVTEQTGAVVPEALGPKNNSPRARRDYFNQASSSRRQAVKEELQQFRPNPAAPLPVLPDQPGTKPPPATPQVLPPQS